MRKTKFRSRQSGGGGSRIHLLGSSSLQRATNHDLLHGPSSPGRNEQGTLSLTRLRECFVETWVQEYFRLQTAVADLRCEFQCAQNIREVSDRHDMELARLNAMSSTQAERHASQLQETLRRKVLEVETFYDAELQKRLAKAKAERTAAKEREDKLRELVKQTEDSVEVRISALEATAHARLEAATRDWESKHKKMEERHSFALVDAEAVSDAMLSEANSKLEMAAAEAEMLKVENERLREQMRRSVPVQESLRKTIDDLRGELTGQQADAGNDMEILERMLKDHEQQLQVWKKQIENDDARGSLLPEHHGAVVPELMDNEPSSPEVVSPDEVAGSAVAPVQPPVHPLHMREGNRITTAEIQSQAQGLSTHGRGPKAEGEGMLYNLLQGDVIGELLLGAADDATEEFQEDDEERSVYEEGNENDEINDESGLRSNVRPPEEHSSIPTKSPVLVSRSASQRTASRTGSKQGVARNKTAGRDPEQEAEGSNTSKAASSSSSSSRLTSRSSSKTGRDDHKQESGSVRGNKHQTPGGAGPSTMLFYNHTDASTVHLSATTGSDVTAGTRSGGRAARTIQVRTSENKQTSSIAPSSSSSRTRRSEEAHPHGVLKQIKNGTTTTRKNEQPSSPPPRLMPPALRDVQAKIEKRVKARLEQQKKTTTTRRVPESVAMLRDRLRHAKTLQLRPPTPPDEDDIITEFADEHGAEDKGTIERSKTVTEGTIDRSKTEEQNGKPSRQPHKVGNRLAVKPSSTPRILELDTSTVLIGGPSLWQSMKNHSSQSEQPPDGSTFASGWL
ncbi:unnamed protein product [Amoebophrya sp. A25]|nr:unnamed protein product [Amoebophrya sp. A25]|eukprot:GSA25T00003037001.1